MLSLGHVMPALALTPANQSTEPSPRKLKSKDRAAQWRRDLEQRTGALLSVAKSPRETAEIEAAYKAEIERGPSFARVRRNATTFGLPAAAGLDRNMLARLIWQFEQIERGMWKTARAHARDHGKRIKPEFARTVLPVLKALAKLTVKHSGRVFPSLEGLAYLAGISRRTAATVIKTLEAWGFIMITRRSKRVGTPFGVRVVQDTSVYRLIMPTGLAAMAMRAMGISSECKTRSARETQNRLSEEEVRVASPIPSQNRLEVLPDTFKTPKRRIHWSELIRPRG